MRTETLTYWEGEEELEGFVAYDETLAGKRPLVLVSHAWGGQNEFFRRKAMALAELGYVGFALDVYGVGRRASTAEESAALMQPFVDDRALLARRMTAALAAARKFELADAKRIAAIGFCFGGLCVLDLARSGADVRGVVSFHGLLAGLPGPAKARIKAKVLVLHGHEDPLVSRAQFDAFTEELTRAEVNWQIHQYGHTVHAFTNPEANARAGGMMYDAGADRRSWLAMQNFLEEVLA